MGFDTSNANAQNVGTLFVAESFVKQFEHFQLALGQRRGLLLKAVVRNAHRAPYIDCAQAKFAGKLLGVIRGSQVLEHRADGAVRQTLGFGQGIKHRFGHGWDCGAATAAQHADGVAPLLGLIAFDQEAFGTHAKDVEHEFDVASHGEHGGHAAALPAARGELNQLKPRASGQAQINQQHIGAALLDSSERWRQVCANLNDFKAVLWGQSTHQIVA